MVQFQASETLFCAIARISNSELASFPCLALGKQQTCTGHCRPMQRGKPYDLHSSDGSSEKKRTEKVGLSAGKQHMWILLRPKAAMWAVCVVLASPEGQGCACGVPQCRTTTQRPQHGSQLSTPPSFPSAALSPRCTI
ncbi:hypothetical protein DL89DRAFT_268204 [Linderina pennispora]|uniref:Uncharacterized protein n=1 Tax=Linderina pennispora TaxID=61395 RepID=A0A1Y1W7J2_9FUNG|nr:uncharacterized protein DL89DRAFT_268204 [Linderina pennispora]ORX69186.1 hypothetical protein DL89DRAFT_268204 [Linderina pennispora]